MAITIKDVAALAGVSASTVSRVCNDNPSISRETRDRVRRAMEQLGYEPNIGTELPAATLHMIGVILPPSPDETYENSFHLKVIRGITQVCNQRQVATTIVTGRDEAEMLAAVKLLHQSRQVDGFILLYAKEQDPVSDYLCEQGLLYVVIGDVSQAASPTISIDNDNLLAGREATEYLWRLGHRRIGYLGSGEGFLYSAERKSGYQLALLQHNQPFRPEYCLESEGPLAKENGPIRRLLAEEDRPTAFVVSDDILAVGLERICVQMGLQIPGDVAIISFNNSLLSYLTYPQLTSVEVNSFQLGFEAASQIINHVENPNLMAAKIIIPHRIIERASSCPVSGEKA